MNEILLTYKASNNKKVAYVKCSCGRNYVVDAYQMKSRKTLSCQCGGRDNYLQRLDRTIALKYYTEKLKRYWSENGYRSY